MAFSPLIEEWSSWEKKLKPEGYFSAGLDPSGEEDSSKSVEFYMSPSKGRSGNKNFHHFRFCLGICVFT